MRAARQSVWVGGISVPIHCCQGPSDLAYSPWIQPVLMSKQISIAQQRKKNMLKQKICVPYLVRRTWEQRSRECPIAQVHLAVRPELGKSRKNVYRTVYVRLYFHFKHGYLMIQSSWASLAPANDSLISLTDSLFMVSALQFFWNRNWARKWINVGIWSGGAVCTNNSWGLRERCSVPGSRATLKMSRLGSRQQQIAW